MDFIALSGGSPAAEDRGSLGVSPGFRRLQILVFCNDVKDQTERDRLQLFNSGNSEYGVFVFLFYYSAV